MKTVFVGDIPYTSSNGISQFWKSDLPIQRSPITWTGRKVKGHQDRDKNYDDLDCWGKANVQADRLAKERMAQVRHQNSPTSTRVKEEGWTVLTNIKLVVRNFESTIILHCTSQEAKEYGSHSVGFSTNSVDLIDWQVFKQVTTYLFTYQQLFITKHSAGILATGKNILQREQRDSNECPQCGTPDEYCDRVLRCDHPKATLTFMTAFAELGLCLQKTTCPAMEAAITDLVLAYKDSTDKDLDDYDNKCDRHNERTDKPRPFPILMWIP